MQNAWSTTKKLAVIAALVILGGCENNNVLMYDGINGQYLPLAQGNIWEYDETTVYDGRDTTIQRMVELDTPYTINGLSWYHTVDICPFRDALLPNPVWCAGYALLGNQVLIQPDGPGPVSYEPQVLLDLPLISGKIWTLYDEDTMYMNQAGDRIRFTRWSRRYVGKMESISVPAGIFSQCVPVEDSTFYSFTIVYANGSTFYQATLNHSLEWYAEGVGMVRQIRTIANSSSDGGEYTSTTTEDLRSYFVRTGE